MRSHKEKSHQKSMQQKRVEFHKDISERHESMKSDAPKISSGNLIMEKKEGKLHTQPTAVVPPKHIPSHIFHLSLSAYPSSSVLQPKA
jgi:hypothetical protein